MIKKLIFDIDNTLIEWKDEYSKKTIEKTCADLGLKCNSNFIKKIENSFDEYENNFEYLSKELFIQNINNSTNLNLSIEFLDCYFKNSVIYGAPDFLPKEKVQTLEALSSKYELVALTNWFATPQIERMKKVDILKYFSNVYSAEHSRMKPYKESFLTAAGNTPVEECCMIGDSFNSDISGALALGMSCVYLTSKPVKLPNCVCINSFGDLKRVFDC